MKFSCHERLYRPAQLTMAARGEGRCERYCQGVLATHASMFSLKHMKAHVPDHSSAASSFASRYTRQPWVASLLNFVKKKPTRRTATPSCTGVSMTRR